MTSAEPEVIRNYTAARRFPQVLGRTPDGKRIPGGPYTLTQAMGAGAVLVLLYLSRSWWTHLGVVGGSLFVIVPLLTVVYTLGRLRPGGRNPLSLVMGGARAATLPRTAKIDGRPLRRRRVHLVASSGYITPQKRENQ